MFNGSIVALVTPMTETGRVDLAGLRRMLDFQLEGGTRAVVIAGTTGESPALDEDEFRSLLQTALEHLGGRIPVIAGTGSASNQRSIEFTRLAESIGADAALLVTPYYVRPPQAGLQAHFESIAGATRLPLILYNVPARTGVDLLPETAASLADGERFVAIKEALPDLDRISRLQELCAGRMTVLSGDDGSCRAAMARGARGVISVAANVAPDHMSRLCNAMLEGDEERAARVDSELRELFRLLSVESNPIPVKWAACRMGLIGPGIRLPLRPLDFAHRPALDACLGKLGLLPAMTRSSVC
jgi:4-hydroxy-tetrahydrodipicolinate synthase